MCVCVCVLAPRRPPSRSSSPSRSVLARTGRKMEGLGYVTITAAQTSGDGSISITVMAADGSACIRGLFSPPDLSSHVPIDTVSEPLPAQAAYVCVHLSVENGAIVLPTGKHSSCNFYRVVLTLLYLYVSIMM